MACKHNGHSASRFNAKEIISNVDFVKNAVFFTPSGRVPVFVLDLFGLVVFLFHLFWEVFWLNQQWNRHHPSRDQIDHVDQTMRALANQHRVKSALLCFRFERASSQKNLERHLKGPRKCVTRTSTLLNTPVKRREEEKNENQVTEAISTLMYNKKLGMRLNRLLRDNNC